MASLHRAPKIHLYLVHRQPSKIVLCDHVGLPFLNCVFTVIFSLAKQSLTSDKSKLFQNLVKSFVEEDRQCFDNLISLYYKSFEQLSV